MKVAASGRKRPPAARGRILFVLGEWYCFVEVFADTSFVVLRIAGFMSPPLMKGYLLMNLPKGGNALPWLTGGKQKPSDLFGSEG